MDAPTLEGFLFIGKLAGLAFIMGWSGTLGMFVVCKMLSWGPVSVIIHNHQNERSADNGENVAEKQKQ